MTIPCQTFDSTGMNCLAQLSMIYSSYTALLTGTRKVRVRHGAHFVEYQPAIAGDVAALRELYEALYSQCPGAALSGLPNLDKGARVKRRGPGFMYART